MRVCVCVSVRAVFFIIFITDFTTGHSIRVHYFRSHVVSDAFYSILFVNVLFSAVYVYIVAVFFSIFNLFSIQLNIFSVSVNSAKPIRII